MLEALRGKAEYYLRPSLKKGLAIWDPNWRGIGPFNGQESRQRAVRKIIEAVQPSVIVETGTYRGITTEWFAQFGMPVHTIEVNPRLHAYSTERLRKYDHVTCHLGRSLDVMESLKASDKAFFYLDAHWDADVPVYEEMREINHRWRDPVVLIDDFHVPDDSYGWLDRGPGRELRAHILGEFEQWPRWYPSTPAHAETGQNTGWVLLCQGPKNRFHYVKELRRLGS